MGDFASESMNLQSGSATVSIVDVSATKSATIDVEDLDVVTYENEVPDNEEDPTTIGVDGGSIKLTLWDEAVDGNGDRFSLQQYFTDQAGIIFPLDLKIELVRDGETHDFWFQFNFSDLNEDYISKKLVIDAQPYGFDDGTSLFDTWANDLLDPRLEETTPSNIGRFHLIQTSFQDVLDVVIPKKVINQALFEQYPSAATTIVSDDFNYDVPTDATEQFYLWMERDDSAFGYWTYPFLTLLDIMASLAALSGSYYGYGFSRKFFVSRGDIDANHHVNIDWNTIEELEIVQRRNIKLSRAGVAALAPEHDEIHPDGNIYDFWGEEHNLISLQSTTGEYPLEDRKVFTAAFSKENLTVGEYDSANDTVDWVFQGDYDNKIGSLAQFGADNYANALGALNPFRIEITAWDITNLLPHQSCSIVGTDAPDLFKNKDYKISKIQYNLITDKYTAELYEV